MSRRSVIPFLILLVLTNIVFVAAQTITTAIPARDFLNSIGVCTHIGQGVDDAAKSAAAMAYAGIRNLRDDGNTAHVQDWITVRRQCGARMSLLTNHDIASTISMAEQLAAAGALLAVEGPNEPNNWPVTYLGQTSSSTTSLPIAKFQRDLHAAVKADTSLKGIPVFHSSEAGGSEPDNCGLQFLTIPSGVGALMPDGTVYADYANTHNYVCGHSGKLVDNVCWSAEDPTLNGDWDGLYVEYGHTWWGAGFNGYTNSQLITLPRVTTETGWTTSGSATSLTEEQQARMFLNLYLGAFKRSWSYTFIYMLRDDPNQGYWGLFHTDYTPKLSGTYLHNLTAILADSNEVAAPGILNYSIANQPATVHDLLMQKSSGVYDLVVWNERPSGGSNSVTVDLGASFPAVKVYDPTTGTSAVQTLADVNSVSLTLSDHPNIVEVIPANSIAFPAGPVRRASGFNALLVLTRGDSRVNTIGFLSNARSGNFVLTVCDVRGRELYRTGVRNAETGKGHTVIMWNGSTNDGTRIGKGVYFVRFCSGAAVEMRKLVLD